jgi:hypothetical protein
LIEYRLRFRRDTPNRTGKQVYQHNDLTVLCQFSAVPEVIPGLLNQTLLSG